MFVAEDEGHTQKSKAGTLPEYDWKVEYIKINDNEFYLNTYECGIKHRSIQRMSMNVKDML